MFNWHQFRLSGLYGLHLLEVPTLTSLLCQCTLSGFGTLEGFQLLRVLTLISLLCDPAWMDMHDFWCTVLTAWVVWSGRLTTPPKGRPIRTYFQVLGSTTFWQLLLWSHLHQHAWLFQPNGYTIAWFWKEGSQATLMEDRRDLRTLLLDICTVFHWRVMLYVKLSLCHLEQGSLRMISLLFQACPALQALTLITFTLICAAACKREFPACSSTLLVRKRQFNQFSGSFKMAE